MTQAARREIPKTLQSLPYGAPTDEVVIVQALSGG